MRNEERRMDLAAACGRLLVVLAAALPGCGRGAGSRTAAIFTDATGEVGLRFVHTTGAAGKYYIPEIMGPGCAFIDYDGDGDLDVYAVDGAPLGDAAPDRALPAGGRPEGPAPSNRLFRNDLIRKDGTRGELRFTDVTGEAGVGDTGYGLGCAAADYDSDGRPDIYVTNFGPNVLYHNEGNGTFTDVTSRSGVGDPRFSVSASFLDYDQDGFLDLFVANYVDFKTTANRYCTRLGGQVDYCGPLSYEPVPDRLYHNERDGTFTDVTAKAGIGKRYGNGLGVVCADLDGDGWIDVFVANDATPNQLWINRRDGTFEDRALVAGCAVSVDGLTQAGMGVTAGDFDNDGDLDIYITHEIGETNTLYRNLGGGLFEDATASVGLATASLPYSGFGTAFFDYDNDGWLDLFVANGAVRKLASETGDPRPFRQPDQLFHNDRGRFVEVTAGAGLEPPPFESGRGAAFGDVDEDGDIDVLVANNGGPLRLLLNNAGSSNGWIRIAVEGTRANRAGHGARVTLTLEDGSKRFASAGADGSYASSSDPRVHFGLGMAAGAASVTVELPGAAPERREGLKPRTTTVVRQREEPGAK